MLIRFTLGGASSNGTNISVRLPLKHLAGLMQTPQEIVGSLGSSFWLRKIRIVRIYFPENCLRYIYRCRKDSQSRFFGAVV